MEPEESKSNRDKDNKSELAGEQLDLKPGTTFETNPGLGSIVYHGFIRRLRFLVVGLHLATFFACFASFDWSADLFAHFRVQYCLLLLASSVVLIAMKSWRLLLVSLICLTVNSSWVAPYLVGGLSPGSPGATSLVESTSQTYRVLSLNVLTRNKQHQSVIDLIEASDPDFVVLMEINSRWQAKLQDSPLLERYPFVEFVPDDFGNFGIAFLSKFKWSDLEVVYVKPLDLASLVIELPLQSSGSTVAVAQSFQIVATHPIPPIDKFRTAARDTQLMDMAGRVRQENPAMMVGDFNLTPWSPRFSKVIEKSGTSDSAIGQGVEPTWYVFPTIFGGLKIDHVLVNDHVRVLKHEVLQDVGSDHRGVLVDFMLIDDKN